MNFNGLIRWLGGKSYTVYSIYAATFTLKENRFGAKEYNPITIDNNLNDVVLNENNL